MKLRPVPSLALLAAVTALAFSALHIVVPALPLLTRLFDDSPAHVQLVLTLYLAGIAGGQLVYGPLSDRFGRRPVLISGLAMFLGGTLICGFAWSIAALIVGRVLEGCGACAGIVLGRAIIRDVYEREAAARGLALVMMAMTLAPALSPAIGAYLTEWFGWRAIFALLGGLGAIMLVLGVVRLDETNPVGAAFDLAEHGGILPTLAALAGICAVRAGSACPSASWFTFHRQRAAHPLSMPGRAAERLWRYDPAADGRLHAGNGGAARFGRVAQQHACLSSGSRSRSPGGVMAAWCIRALARGRCSCRWRCVRSATG